MRTRRKFSENYPVASSSVTNASHLSDLSLSKKIGQALKTQTDLLHRVFLFFEFQRFVFFFHQQIFQIHALKTTSLMRNLMLQYEIDNTRGGIIIYVIKTVTNSVLDRSQEAMLSFV
jgi:hypothetical protein